MIARLQAHWRLKLLLTVLFNVVFWPVYSLLGHHAYFPLHLPMLTWFDRAIPFQTSPWSLVYLSQFLFSGAVPWLIDTTYSIRRYVMGLTFMSLVSFACFYFFPVASPRPQGPPATSLMQLIVHYDGLFNAFPSLHAGFFVFISLFVRRIFGPSLTGPIKLTGALWGIAIFYSTIATRQHYAVDLAAGALIGATADWLAWRGSSEPAPSSTTFRSKGMMSQEGSR